MDRVRFCLVGTGRAGMVHGINITRRIKNAELVALVDSNERSLKESGEALGVTGRHADYREALSGKDIDAVVVVTPTFTHAEIACYAAEQGKHIMLEKPMAITVDECAAINAAVKDNGVKLQLGFMRRFDPAFVRAKEIIESGELGRVMIIKSTGRGPGLPPAWTYDLSQSNGMLAEVNSHDFDTVRWLVGSDYDQVYALAENFKCDSLRKDYPGFYDNAVVNFRLKDGTLGSIDGTCPAGYGYDARVEILCEHGLLLVGDFKESGMTWVRRDGTSIGSAFRSWRDRFKDAYLAEMEHFVEAIVKDGEPAVTGEDGIKAVEAVIAANESIRTGRPVRLGQVKDMEC
ncbi:MAG: Gfo/Idh/MocA family oxidoreductase [Deltaproteobacteria bacterium]|nr:Gfo/Idh/MocA family oxidoreductase [Deltaproteobacteria bacterium]